MIELFHQFLGQFFGAIVVIAICVFIYKLAQYRMQDQIEEVKHLWERAVRDRDMQERHHAALLNAMMEASSATEEHRIALGRILNELAKHAMKERSYSVKSTAMSRSPRKVDFNEVAWQVYTKVYRKHEWDSKEQFLHSETGKRFILIVREVLRLSVLARYRSIDDSMGLTD